MFSRCRFAQILCVGALLACGADSGMQPVRAARLDAVSAGLTASGPSASGHATLIQQPSGARRTFSFEARRMPDGTVRGEFVNHNRQQDMVNHGDIDCFRLLGPNSAVMSGPIRKHTTTEMEGWTTIFTVEDNGEGSGDAGDRVSQLVNLPPGVADCTSRTPVLLPIIGGNVQVRP